MSANKGETPNKELTRLKHRILAELNDIERATEKLELEIKIRKKHLLNLFKFGGQPPKPKKRT
jgi:hypothetical protein